MCKYSKRLLKEWIRHEKIVLSVDYDDTLFPYDAFGNNKDVVKTVKSVLKAQKLGAYVVIFTATNPERYNEILKYCKDLGIVVDSINRNPIDLPYGKDGKIYYNINLCDRSGLREALTILNKARRSYKIYKKHEKNRKTCK